MTDQPRVTPRVRRLVRAGALLPVVLTFGLALWGDVQSRGWLQLPSATAKAEAAVAGASTERSPDWDLAAKTGRTPEEVVMPMFTSSDAATAARAAGTAVGERDLVASYPDPSWGYGGLGQVWRAQSIKVIDGGRTKTFTTWQPTVADALVEQKIELGDQDKISPALGTPIQTADAAAPFVITITRVELTTVVVKESIPITTTYKDDPTAEKGTEKVLDAGQAGTKALTYLVRREDGVEIKRTLQSTAVEKAMKAKVVSRGTKVLVYGTGKATYYTCSLNHVAASNVIARNTKLRVVNLSTGKSTVVTVVGTGGPGMAAIVDLSCDAFSELAGANWRAQGTAPVRVEKFYPSTD